MNREERAAWKAKRQATLDREREKRRQFSALKMMRARDVVELTRSIKLERGCEFVLPNGSVCGYREHYAALEFDHRDPLVKKFNISAGVLSKHRDELMDEIAKCDVLCANHHRIRSAAESHHLVRRPRDVAA